MFDALSAYKSLERPFASLDLDALDWNIRMVNKLSKKKKVRVATKSIRSVEVLRYIADRLDRHCGWMTFDLQETKFLLERGFDRFLIGYPQMEKREVIELIPFIKAGKEVVFMVDSLPQWKWLHDIGISSDTVFSVCLDIDMSTVFKWLHFGTRRSSLRNAEQVMELLTASQELTHAKAVGVMGYEAQLAGVADRPVTEFLRPVIKRLKSRAEKSVSHLRQEIVKMIRGKIPDLQFVNGGGSGSLRFTAASEEVTEVTVGSAFFYPALFSRYDDLPFEPAAMFALRVTRKPEKNVVVCHGGGYVASGAVGKDKTISPYFPKHLSLLKNEGAGEVQTPLLDKEQKLKIGDTVFFRHAKAGELCERFNELHARRGDIYVKAFKTYRGEGGCFL